VDLLQGIITLAAIVAAILGWSVRLWWGREYTAAKDEIIRAKDVQLAGLEREIAFLKERTPRVIEEHAETVQKQLSGIVEATQALLAAKSQADDELFLALAESVAHLMSNLDPPIGTLKTLPLTALLLVRDLLFFVALQSQTERRRILGRLCLRVLDAAEAQAVESGQGLTLTHYTAQIRPPRSKFFEKLPDILDQGKVRKTLMLDDDATVA